MTGTLPMTAPELADWLPLAKAFGFFLATFVLEDVATVGAGLLLATGGITWPLAFPFCFFGIVPPGKNTPRKWLAARNGSPGAGPSS
jgi:hypothetical protein